MPFLPAIGAALVAAAPAIAAGTGLASLGVTGYELAQGQPGGGQATSQATGPTQAQAVASETANRNAATLQAEKLLPNLQAQGGGGLSPDYLAQQSSYESGNSQYAQSPQIMQAIQQFLGNSGIPGNSTTSTTLPGLNGTSNPAISGATNSFFNSNNQQNSNPFAATGLF